MIYVFHVAEDDRPNIKNRNSAKLEMYVERRLHDCAIFHRLFTLSHCQAHIPADSSALYSLNSSLRLSAVVTDVSTRLILRERCGI